MYCDTARLCERRLDTEVHICQSMFGQHQTPNKPDTPLLLDVRWRRVLERDQWKSVTSCHGNVIALVIAILCGKSEQGFDFAIDSFRG